jgi:hypothetical protein
MVETYANSTRLGIVYLVKGQLLVASSPLAGCEDGAGFKNYPGDHQHFWEELQQLRAVPPDYEYENFPRGRAVFNRGAGRFSLYLDRCILSKQKIVRRIISQLHLPANTIVADDPHYRCSKCLGVRGCP